MSHNVRDAVPEAGFGPLFIKQDSSHSVCNQAPVLHCAMRELMHSQDIALGKRVVNAKLLGEEVDDLGSVLQRPVALFLQAAGGVDAHGELFPVVSALRESLYVLEVANCPAEQVGGHDWRSLEGHKLPALRSRLGILDGHVAQGNLVGGDLNGEVEGGLEVRLIETGKGAAGISTLELGAGHVVKLVITRDGSGSRDHRFVLGSIETSHVMVDDAVKVDSESGLGDGQLRVKGDDGPLRSGVVGDL